MQVGILVDICQLATCAKSRMKSCGGLRLTLNCLFKSVTCTQGDFPEWSGGSYQYTSVFCGLSSWAYSWRGNRRSACCQSFLLWGHLGQLIGLAVSSARPTWYTRCFTCDKNSLHFAKATDVTYAGQKSNIIKLNTTKKAAAQSLSLCCSRMLSCI